MACASAGDGVSDEVVERARLEGRLLLGLRRHEDALAVFGRALAHAPEDGDLLWGVATACLELDRVDEAGRAAAAAVRANPLDPDAHLVMCRAYRRVGRTEEARQHAERAVALAPDAPEPAWMRVVAAIESDQDDDAVAVARWMLQRFPDHHMAHLAMAWASMGKVRRLEFTWWIIPAVVLTRGLVLLALGVRWAWYRRRAAPWLREADRHLQQALRLGADDPRVHRVAAIVLGFRGDWAGAVQRRVTAARQDPLAGEGDELLASLRGRVARGELLGVLGLWIGTPTAAALGGPLGVGGFLLLCGGPVVAWAVDRRRRVRRSLPPVLAKRLSDDRLWWLGPTMAVVAAVQLAVASLG